MASVCPVRTLNPATITVQAGSLCFRGGRAQGRCYRQRCPARTLVLVHAKPRKVKQAALTVTTSSKASVEEEAIVNSRDLASVCPSIQPGLLIRSGCPFRNTKEPALDLNIQHLIDLRNPEEWSKDDKAAHDSWKGAISTERIFRRSDDGKSTRWETVQRDAGPEATIQLHRISVLDRNRFQKHLIYNKMDIFTIMKVVWFKCFDSHSLYNTIIGTVNDRGLDGMYEVLLDTAAPEFGAALDVVLEAAEAKKPTLFFCKLGKDRTGLLGAMLLGLMGADEQTIIDDYSLSDTYGAVALGGMEKKELAGLDRSIFQRAPPETMEKTLEYCKFRYESLQGYMEFCGFGLEKQARLRAALLREEDHPSQL